MIPRLVVRGVAIFSKYSGNKYSVTGIIARCVMHIYIYIYTRIYMYA